MRMICPCFIALLAVAVWRTKLSLWN